MPEIELLLVGHFPPPVHGAAVVTLALAEQLGRRARVIRVDLACPAWTSPLSRRLAKLTQCVRAAARIVRHRLRGQRRVLIGGNGGIGTLCTLLLVSSARLCGCDASLHHHSYNYIDRASWRMRLICRIGGRRLRHVFLAATMREAFFARYRQHAPALVLGNAVFVPSRRQRSSVPGRLVVGLIGNLAPDKGLDDFLAVAARVHALQLPVRMLLAGPLAARGDRAAVAHAVAAGHLQACGPLYGAAKQAFFEGIDLLLFPTRYRHEAQPTVIYEAFAAGVPTLAFDRGAIRDQVGDCLRVVARDADFAAAALAEIQRLLTLDADGWSRLHRKVRQRHRVAAAVGAATLADLVDGDRERGARRAP
jgi:glycosyltransferase involved in cell wall biosynthesis